MVRPIRFFDLKASVNELTKAKIELLRSSKEIPAGKLKRRDIEGIKEYGRQGWADKLEKDLLASETEHHW